ncbi:hypothetical protein [Thermodesulfatator atlanticus]|uniref:hypothetical protein n=1 Tax=Thermodesulfatator atlanticus TaxID=501497 RepID=UPI0003B5FB2F|nr:hypothetical protein [Thermodesulfatator atlanticus]
MALEARSQESKFTVEIPLRLLRDRKVKNFLAYLEVLEILEKVQPDEKGLLHLLEEIREERRKEIQKEFKCA